MGLSRKPPFRVHLRNEALLPEKPNRPSVDTNETQHERLSRVNEQPRKRIVFLRSIIWDLVGQK